MATKSPPASVIKTELKPSAISQLSGAGSHRNIVRIGKKPVSQYTLAALLMFSRGEKNVTLQARGKSILTAINVEEIIKRSMPLTKIEVKLGTEELDTQDKITKKAYTIKVSTIDIVMKV